MRSTATGRRFLEGFFLLLVCAGFAVGCGRQGEGERCDVRNGNADCESGLVCTPASDLIRVAGGENAALCCPARGQASVTACIADDTSFGGAGGALATGGAAGAAAAGGQGGTAGTPGTPTGGSDPGGQGGTGAIGSGATGGSGGSDAGAGGSTMAGGSAGLDASAPDAGP
jgi:hypothetical protein